MCRRIVAKKILSVAVMRNINQILNNMTKNLMDVLDKDGQIYIKIYKIGKNNIQANQIVKQGTIDECLEWCIEQQQTLKIAFNSFIDNVKRNTDRKVILKYAKKLKNIIQQSNLYTKTCFNIINKFIKQISVNNEKEQISDALIHNMIFGDNGIKSKIDLYRTIVTSGRVSTLKSLRDYYTNSNNKTKYGLGIKTINKVISNNETLFINTKNHGQILIKPIQVRKQEWSLIADKLDENGNVIQKIIICQSDIKK